IRLPFCSLSRNMQRPTSPPFPYTTLFRSIFQPESISYHVFLLEEHPDLSLTIRGIESFNLFPYPGLHQDCCALLAQFKAYVVGKDRKSTRLNSSHVKISYAVYS